MPAPANVAAPAPAPKPTMSISEDAKKVAIKLQREALERIEKGSAELDELFVKSWKEGRRSRARGIAAREPNARVPRGMRRAESQRRDAVEWTVNPQPRRQKTGGHPGGPPSVGQFTNVTKLEVELARSQTGRKGNARDSLIACVVFQPHSPLVGIADSLSYRSLRGIVTFKW